MEDFVRTSLNQFNASQIVQEKGKNMIPFEVRSRLRIKRSMSPVNEGLMFSGGSGKYGSRPVTQNGRLYSRENKALGRIMDQNS